MKAQITSWIAEIEKGCGKLIGKIQKGLYCCECGKIRKSGLVSYCPTCQARKQELERCLKLFEKFERELKERFGNDDEYWGSDIKDAIDKIREEMKKC